MKSDLSPSLQLVKIDLEPLVSERFLFLVSLQLRSDDVFSENHLQLLSIEINFSSAASFNIKIAGVINY